MQVNGQLKTAQIENLGADPTGTGLVEGRIWYRTDTFVYKAYANSTVIEIVDLATAQALLAKTLTGAKISDFLEYAHGTTPSTPSAGNVRIYAKSDNTFYVLDSTGTEIPLGSGSGGGKNYVPSGSDTFDSSVGDWLAYKNASPTATPETGTGGSPTIVVLSRTVVAGEVQRGSGSLKFNKGSGSGIGEGAGLVLNPVDYIDQGKNITTGFEYKTDANYVTGDVGVYRYDIDGATLVKISDLESSSINGSKFTAVFPTNTGNDDYRLILHVQTANAAIYNIFLDTVGVGPDSEITTPVITPWTDYTPTFTGYGTATAIDIESRRVGEMLEVRGVFTAGTPTAVEGRVSLGFNGSDGSVTTASALPTISHAGSTATSHAGTTTNFRDHLVLTEASVAYMTFGNYDSTTAVLTKVNGNNMVNTGATISIDASFKIAGWDSGAVVSNTQLQNQTINFGAYRTTSVQTLTAGVEAEIVFNGERYDSHGAYSTSTGRFTAPRKGKYSLRGTVVIATGGTAPSGISSYFKVNGATPLLGNNSENDLVNNKSYTLTSVADVELDVGDYVTLWGISSGQNSDVGNSGGNNDVSSLYGHSIPDFTTYGVIKDNVEYQEVEYDTTQETVTADTYVDAASSGGTITLTPGTWDIGYDVTIKTDWIAGATAFITANVVITDSSNAIVDKTISIAANNLDATYTSSWVPASRSTRITVTSSTTYKLRVRSNVAAAAAIATVGDNTLTGGLTDDDNHSILWARRVV